MYHFNFLDFYTGTKLHNPWIVTLSFALYTECSHYLPPTASPKLPCSAAAAAAARRGIAATAVAATAAVLRQHCGAAAEMERRHIFFWHDHDRSHISQTRRLELLFLEAMPSLSFSTELSCALPIGCMAADASLKNLFQASFSWASYQVYTKE